MGPREITLWWTPRSYELDSSAVQLDAEADAFATFCCTRNRTASQTTIRVSTKMGARTTSGTWVPSVGQLKLVESCRASPLQKMAKVKSNVVPISFSGGTLTFLMLS